MTTVGGINWGVLGFLSIILLIVYWSKKSAVWGGFTAGIIIGIIVLIFNLFKGNGFKWTVVCVGAIIGTITGLLTELLGKVGDYFKKKES